ncbi:uncharacterized protein LOC130719847 [Lotus japonicus]|uniref:uncharacterized protein LOC130719847 n=1 Tax=Lotus japonicus TaxID=34305 RepID=UPI002586CEB2|nr:uncharacterized protein LOC130719847 [Lotus japonicus]
MTKGVISSFFFSHFPESHGEHEMWRFFEDWGKVWEVFIPKKRDKLGNRFGFVRFQNVKEPSLLAEKLDRAYIGGKKLFVNIPRFSKQPVMKPRKGFEPTAEGPRAEPKGVVMGRNQQGEKDPLPFKEVLLKGLKSTSERKIVEETQGKIPLLSDRCWQVKGMKVEGKVEKWLENSWVGKLKDLESLNTIQDNFFLEGDKAVKVRYLGDYLVLLTDDDDEALKEVLKDKEGWIGDMFEELNPWSPHIYSDFRISRVRCTGIPLHFWNMECFNLLVSEFGTLVGLDEATSSFKRLEFARLKVRTTSENPISWFKKLNLNGKEYGVRFQEEQQVIFDGFCSCHNHNQEENVDSSCWSQGDIDLESLDSSEPEEGADLGFDRKEQRNSTGTAAEHGQETGSRVEATSVAVGCQGAASNLRWRHLM